MSWNSKSRAPKPQTSKVVCKHCSFHPVLPKTGRDLEKHRDLCALSPPGLLIPLNSFHLFQFLIFLLVLVPKQRRYLGNFSSSGWEWAVGNISLFLGAKKLHFHGKRTQVTVKFFIHRIFLSFRRWQSPELPLKSPVDLQIQPTSLI